MRIIGGEWGGRRIQAPPGRDTRPTTDRVRESWFTVLGDVLAKQGRRREAVAAYREAERLAPDKWYYHRLWIPRAR